MCNAGDEKHTCCMKDATQRGRYCQALQKGASLNGVEVQEEGHKERYVLRRVAMSANCLGELSVGAAPRRSLAQSHARDIGAQPRVEDDQDAGAEKEDAHSGIVRYALRVAPNV